MASLLSEANITLFFNYTTKNIKNFAV